MLPLLLGYVRRMGLTSPPDPAQQLRTARSGLALTVGFTLAAIMCIGSWAPAVGASGEAVVDRDTVRLQVGSFRTRSTAKRFAASHQLAWNDCVLGQRLGVVPPGRASLPAHCTAQAQIALLDVERAFVGGRAVYRVVTQPIAAVDLWGAVQAFRLAGLEPLVVK